LAISLNLIVAEERHFNVIAWQFVQTSRPHSQTRVADERRYPSGRQRQVHTLVIAIDGAIIGHCVDARTLDTVQQAIIDWISAFTIGLFHGHSHQVVAQALNTIT
jgi:glutamate-1-semialdehyde aminotransferase